MTLPTPLAKLLVIHTDDEEARQKGELVQAVILTLSGVAIFQIIFNVINILNTGWVLPEGYRLIAEIIIVPLFCFAGLLLVRNGRSNIAAHSFFIFLNTIFFLLLLQTNNVETYPYLMLISIIAIATMVSVKMSILYATLVIISISAYYIIRQPTPNYINNAVTFTLITLSISAIAWLTADRLQKWVRESTRLSRDMEAQTKRLQHRAQQLQRSATISQSTSNILDLDTLLENIVYTIRDQYDFYFVAIYLLNQAETKLVLREAVGVIGEELKRKRFRLKIEDKSIISWVAQNQEPRISHDVENDPYYFNDPLLKETQSEAAIPLIARGKLLGVLDVQSQQANAFDTEDIAILEITANQLAINVDNAQLFSQTESYLAETQTIINLNTALTTTMDVGEIYRRAARTFSMQLRANLSIITNWNQDNDVAISQVMHLYDPGEAQINTFNLNPYTFTLAHFTGINHVLTEQTPRIQHKSDADLSQPAQNFMAEHDQESSLIVPLTHGSAPLGVVLLFRAADQAEFTKADTQLAKVMANETAIALNNALLTSEAQGRVAQLSALNRLSNRLSLAPTMQDVFEGIQREVLSLFEATTISIMLVTQDEAHFRWAYANEYGRELDLSSLSEIPISQGFTGQVIQTRRPLLFNKDIADKTEQFSAISVGASTSAWLGVPLIVANKTIGVLVIENEDDAGAFDERTLELMETIAGSTAIAISNQLTLIEIQTALEAQSEQRLQLQTAAEVSAATNSILELNDLMEDAVSLIKERFSLYYTGIFLNDPHTNQAVLKAATGEAGKIQLEKGHKLTIGGHSLIGGATDNGRSRITQDVTQDEEWQPNPYLPDTRAELALPLRVRGDIIGALTVQSTQPHAFSPELVSILQTMSDQLAIAIDNSRLLAMAESRVQRQRVLNQISNQLHNSADTDEILRVGLKALSEQINGRSVNLFLGNQSEEKATP